MVWIRFYVSVVVGVCEEDPVVLESGFSPFMVICELHYIHCVTDYADYKHESVAIGQPNLYAWYVYTTNLQLIHHVW